MKPVDQVSRELDALFKPLSPASEPISTPVSHQAPQILEEPEDAATTVYHARTFTVRARGTAPITAQWRQNGSPIKFSSYTKGTQDDGVMEFSFEYSHTPVSRQDGGTIDVVISNSAGTKTCKPAKLTVKETPEKSPLDDAAAFHQTPIAEMKRIKAKENRRLKGLPEKFYEDEQVHFQDYQFSNQVRRGSDPLRDVEDRDSSNWGKGLGKREKNSKARGHVNRPKGPQHGVDAEGNLHDMHVTLFGGLSKGTGVSVKPVESDPAAMGHRDDSPWWFLDERCLRDLLLRLANKKLKSEDRFVEGKDFRPAPKDRIKAAGLDYQILYEYYRLRREDKEIFEKYKDSFAKEKKDGHRQRATSSAAAVKRRRLRLVGTCGGLYQGQRVSSAPGISET